jgi:type I restriction enzyme S subunit
VQIGEISRTVKSWNPAAASNEETFTYIDISSVSQERKLVDVGAPILTANAPSRARQLVETDDILVSTVRPNLNAVARVLPEHDGATASTGFCVLRPEKSLVDPAYLFHWVRCPEFVSEMVTLATGQSYPAVSDKIIKGSKIPLPPLEEQRRIAAILDQADALRRLRARALDRFNALGQAIFHEMFGDLKTNPKGWGKSKLGQIGEVGSSKRVFVEEFVSTGVPFYRGTEVGQLGASGEVHPSLFIAEDHYEALIQHSGKPQIGDLLLPSICHDGRIWRVDTDAPFYFKDGRVLWIKSSQASIDGEFLRRYLQQVFLTSYSSIASGTTFAELKIVNLKGLDVLVPPADVQHTFAKRMAAVDAQKLDAASALGRLTALFATLQSKAFAGGL